ncbi:DMT family transporter [Pseudomonas sp. 148P]|uniref:DMT family transporter n=1 Tax=Pseudomonas ulcerans TaxID=3115852 RepID=A0ABU7HWL3_9PSED|nr:MULTISPECIES: DMT family transporter [unclassified Pseudomonas]MEE1924548.1 DMT family transporter [Pseudomonas sp. 147P]MEE1935962.1 DMT family transporter [Pseudomonas sp. 148P]
MNVLLPVLATLIWAASTVVNRLSVGVIDPAAISFYRWLTALLVLSPVLLPRAWRIRRAIRPHLPRLWLLGLLGMSLYQSLAYFAAHTVSATSMGLILATMPLLTVLVAFPLLNTRPTLPLLVGAAISFVGLAWLLAAGDLSSLWQHGVGLGEGLMLLASLSYALYCVLVKRWQIPLPIWESLYVQILCGTLLLVPPFLLASSMTLSAQSLPLVLFAGLFASALAPGLWIHGLQRLGAEKTAVLMNLVPLFTAVLAIGLLGETLHLYHAVGGGLILLGIALAQWQPARLPVSTRP